MSEKLINRSADLQRLRDEGYSLEVLQGYLVVRYVPYVSGDKDIANGIVVTDLNINADEVLAPTDHQVWFAGDHPCNLDGTKMRGLGNDAGRRTLCDGLAVDYRFSCKLEGGVQYPDYYSKIAEYVRIISAPAKALAPNVDARTFEPLFSADDDSVFRYSDSASSRAGILQVSCKLAQHRVAVIGLGGIGSYVLDLLAKTPIKEIHLFDGDLFLQHNAFRAPGAASLDELKERAFKVDYFATIYGKMRHGIYTHPHFITERELDELAHFDFVFLCVDRPFERGIISRHLVEKSIPFVDTGLEIEHIEETHELVGICRVTASSPTKSDHFSHFVSTDSAVGDDLYASNIQVADLNALCATLAVVKWKKISGFYQDCIGEHHSAYAINAHELTKDACPDSP